MDRVYFRYIVTVEKRNGEFRSSCLSRKGLLFMMGLVNKITNKHYICKTNVELDKSSFNLCSSTTVVGL